MDKSYILKNEILKKYRSVRQFCLELDIPYSTLVTALDRGIEGMAYGTVIRICEHLHLNPVDFTSLDEAKSENIMSQRILDDRVLRKYRRLNQPGRELMLTLMEDLSQLNKYSGVANL